MLVVVQGPQPGTVPVRCALCHDALGELPPPCPGCRTLVHAECAAGRPCPTLGCPRRLRARARVFASPPRDSRWLLAADLVVYAAAAAFLLALGAEATTPRMGQSDAARRERARADFRVLHEAAEWFQKARGRSPVEFDDLAGFLKEHPPIDPWGQPYLLLPRPDGVEFFCLGPDGRAGGDDDLHSRPRLPTR